jgi:hypothetical protein
MSKKPQPPSKGSPWESMARELASNPDSPASLHIMSAVNSALRPRQQAVDQLVNALAAQVEHSDVGTDAAVSAATKHWETACQVTASAEALQPLRNEAAELVKRRLRHPPALESILPDVRVRLDAGYELGVSLEGLRGTWHRLWAAISLSKTWGDDVGDPSFIGVILNQFELALGRAMTASEWSQLVEHATRHAENVMKPGMTDGSSTK